MDAGPGQLQKLWRHPRDQVGPRAITSLILDHRDPRIPRRRVVNIEEPIRFGFSGAISQIIVRKVDQQSATGLPWGLC